jgi:HSP20 family protein
MPRKKGETTELVRHTPLVPSFGGPFEVMRRFGDELNDVFADFGSWRDWPVPFWGFRSTTGFEPRVDVFERDKKLVVRADVPGLDPKELKVEITEEALTLEGERKEEKEERHEGVYRSERSYGHFVRRIPLPEGVEADKAEASFRNGVLEVTMPAPALPETHARRLEIKEAA